MNRFPALSRRTLVVSAFAMAGLLLATFAVWPTGAAEKTPKTKPTTSKTKPGAKGDSVPLYVGAWSVDHEWELVTKECIEIIKTKRILFGSRSWGLGLGDVMGNKDPKYKIIWNSMGSKVQVDDQEKLLKPDVFAQPNLCHFVFKPVPKRWTYIDDFIRKDPWKFGSQLDGAFQILYCGAAKEAEQDFVNEYFPMLDKLIEDYPNIKFGFITHPVSGAGMYNGKEKTPDSDWNIGGATYSDEGIRRYYGKIPIFDMRDIASTHPDGKPCTFEKNGKTYRLLCPEYNIKDGDLIHLNTPVARERVGKGFLIFLTKMFCADKLPKLETPLPEVLKNDAGAKK